MVGFASSNLGNESSPARTFGAGVGSKPSCEASQADSIANTCPASQAGILFSLRGLAVIG
jgi:hypothetical protein